MRLESHIFAFSTDFLNIQANNLRAMKRLVGILDALHLMLRTVFGDQQGEGRHPLCFVQTVMCRTLQYDAFISRSKLVRDNFTATSDTERHVGTGVNAAQFTSHRCTMDVNGVATVPHIIFIGMPYAPSPSSVRIERIPNSPSFNISNARASSSRRSCRRTS